LNFQYQTDALVFTHFLFRFRPMLFSPIAASRCVYAPIFFYPWVKKEK
jgi:hypothetical protein